MEKGWAGKGKDQKLKEFLLLDSYSQLVASPIKKQGH